MFFENEDLALKKHSRLKVAPPIIDTGWRPPTAFPNLSAASVLSFDVETKDAGLQTETGPGWSRGKSSVVGFSVAARTRGGEHGKWYFPIRHEVGSEYNLDAKQCLGWLNEQLDTTKPKVGANLLYDIGCLHDEGVKVSGVLHDVQFAEALLDEEGSVALDWLGRKYLNQRKTTDDLYAWLALAYGGAATGKQRENIYRASPILVGPYGEDDADLPLQILDQQWPLLEREGLHSLFALENRLIPLLIKMRLQGVAIDVKYCEDFYVELGRDIVNLEHELAVNAGFRVNVNSNQDIAKLFDQVGIKYPRTAATAAYPNGQPSFQKEWLKTVKHPAADAVNNIREHIKVRNTFVRNYLLNANVNGIIHCQFHPLKGDENGTKTGRFASSDPNLQNIPVRTSLGKRIRKAFVPFPGHLRWRKFDYSQIEYRMLAHFAIDGKIKDRFGAGDFDLGEVLEFWRNPEGVWGYYGIADGLRSTYGADPKTDFHVKVMVEFARAAGIDLSKMSEDEVSTFRKPIKNVNFGIMYGQSEKALAYKSGLTPVQAKPFFATYHETAPYVRATMAAISAEVQQFGFVRTILNRRTRFNQWEPADFQQRGMPMHYEAALAEYGSNIKRSYDYRGTNYKFQGSAADVIKKAMDDAHTSGVFDYIGYPLLQVHDELDFSERDDTPAMREAYAYLTHVLENSIKLKVPVKVDSSHGKTWADAK